MPKQVLKVYANPFAAELDHEGRAHGHVHYAEEDHPAAHGQAPRFVGCRLLASLGDQPPVTKPQPGHAMDVTGKRDQSNWDHVWEYDTEPTTLVPQSPASLAYYLSLLQQGGHHGPALLPADEATWKLVHGTVDGFRDPRARLHQLVGERGATPRLQPSEPVRAKLAARDLVGAPPHVAGYERDHAAEWDAFVAPALKAEADAKAKAEAAETVPATPAALHAAAAESTPNLVKE